MLEQEAIEFIVGEEKRLTDVLGESEVMPLLRSAAQAGMELAAVVDTADTVLWAAGLDAIVHGSGLPVGQSVQTETIYLSGENVGRVCLSGGETTLQPVVKIIAQVIGDAINCMIQTNLKRMMVTEIHTQVVQLSYDELLEANRLLTVSEQKYRELAQNLEVRVHERTAELKQVYGRMLQQEKMASVGHLAAGMAHEINNPLSFVLSNLKTLEKYAERFVAMMNFYDLQTREHELPALQEAISKKRRNLKIDYIISDLADLFTQSLRGAERVKKIVGDLRGFSHIDDLGSSQVDIHEEIERTLSVLSPEIPADAVIVKELGKLPSPVCKGALLCQAFLNIIRNALQARPQGLKLVIRTDVAGSDFIRIIFRDNGPGIPDTLQKRIFEPFFSTRDVGSGMGLGLTVAYDAVMSCGGTIAMKSKVGKGAAFVIMLPINGRTHE